MTGVQVIKASSRGSADRQLAEAVPLEDGEQVLLTTMPVRFHRPYSPGPLVVLRKIIETSTRGILRLTDRRLVLLRVKVSGPSEAYVIPRERIAGVEPAGGGYLRLVCDDPALPTALTGIKAGMTALETGIVGGLLGSGPAESIAGSAVMGTTQGRRAGTLLAVLERELGAR